MKSIKEQVRHNCMAPIGRQAKLWVWQRVRDKVWDQVWSGNLASVVVSQVVREEVFRDRFDRMGK